MMRPRPRLQHALLTAHCSLLTAHCPLLTAHCSLLTFFTTPPSPVTLSSPGRGCSESSRRISPPLRRQTASWLSTSAPAGSTLLLEGALWLAHPSPLRASGLTRASLGPGLLCALHRGAPWPPRPQWQPMVLPQLTTHHSPPTTYRSRRPTTCSRCRLISRRRPLPQRPRWPTHSPRSPPSPQHDRASSSPPPRSPRCARAARAAAASRARAPPSPQGCGSCSRQPRCSPTAPPTGAAAPARSTAMHQGLPPREPGAAAHAPRGCDPMHLGS